jgi:drug/metabolite transporter (DMT)-like permease
VSVSTTSHTAGALQHPGFGYLSWAWAVSMMGIALAPGRDRLRRSARRYLGLIVLALLVFVGGCGGGGSSHQSPNGTPAGSYTLMVTASSGSASQSISLALTVQ